MGRGNGLNSVVSSPPAAKEAVYPAAPGNASGDPKSHRFTDTGIADIVDTSTLKSERCQQGSGDCRADRESEAGIAGAEASDALLPFRESATRPKQCFRCAGLQNYLSRLLAERGVRQYICFVMPADSGNALEHGNGPRQRKIGGEFSVCPRRNPQAKIEQHLTVCAAVTAHQTARHGPFVPPSVR